MHSEDVFSKLYAELIDEARHWEQKILDSSGGASLEELRYYAGCLNGVRRAIRRIQTLDKEIHAKA